MVFNISKCVTMLMASGMRPPAPRMTSVVACPARSYARAVQVFIEVTGHEPSSADDPVGFLLDLFEPVRAGLQQMQSAPGEIRRNDQKLFEESCRSGR